MLARLLLLLALLAGVAAAQDEQLLDGLQLDPVGDPFKINPRLNLFYEHRTKENGAALQTFNFNPVWALSDHSSLQLSLPLGYYYPGTTGNGVTHGLGDTEIQYFQRFQHGPEIAHGAGLKLTVDAGKIPNVGGGATSLSAAYAYEYVPAGEDLKLLLVSSYENSLGTLAGTGPTRKATLRLVGYRYIDAAYVGVELRQEFDFVKGQYSPFGAVSTGGELTEGVQLWVAFRLALSEVARSSGDRFRFTVGVTVPLE